MVSCAMRHLHCKRNRYLGSWLEMKKEKARSSCHTDSLRS